MHLQRLVGEGESLGGLGDVLLGGFPDGGGVDGVEAEGGGEVLREAGVGADGEDHLEGDGLAILVVAAAGVRGGLSGLLGHDLRSLICPGCHRPCAGFPPRVWSTGDGQGGSGNP